MMDAWKSVKLSVAFFIIPALHLFDDQQLNMQSIVNQQLKQNLNRLLQFYKVLQNKA
jgi:hypothetical protein